LAEGDSKNDLIKKLSFQTSDDLSLKDLSLSNINSTPSETFKETLSQVGISIPQVDRRIYLDAFFQIVNIQKILHHEILFIIQELSKESKEVWKNFIERLQSSIQEHLNTIRKVAESTHYGRHLLLVDVEILEFDLKLLEYQLRFPPNGIVSKALQDKITEKCKDIKERIIIIIGSQRYENSEEGFKNDIHKRLRNLSKNCHEVEDYAHNLSTTLSIEEKLEIHQAMQTEFKTSGTNKNLFYYKRFIILEFIILTLLLIFIRTLV
jgi:hypothetical protein